MLFVVLVSHPLARLLSQLPNPELQLMPQAPLLQVAVPFVALHTVVQLLQWLGSFLRFISQPSVRLLLQSENPGLHVIPQVPAVQLGVPLFAEQALPHVAQLDTVPS
jgi:hypothetical protein